MEGRRRRFLRARHGEITEDAFVELIKIDNAARRCGNHDKRRFYKKSACLMVTHNLVMAERCDRIVDLVDGRIVAARRRRAESSLTEPGA